MKASDSAKKRPLPADDRVKEGNADAETAAHRHDDELADEWGDESFPSSDPPANY